MRIAYLCADFGIPVFGSKGASIHVRELVRALRSLGHDVLVITPRAAGERPGGFDAAVEPIAVDPAHETTAELLAGDAVVGRALAREVRALLYGGRLRRRGLDVLRRFEPDVVYERYSLFGNAGLELARSLGVPLVLEVNAPLSDEQAQHRGLVLAELARRTEGEVLRAADHVVTVSTALERWLLERGVDPGRVIVVPNGVDAARFDVSASQLASARAQLGAREGALVGFLGSLRPWHDVSGLIDALARLRAKRRRVKLVVIGDGPERERLEDRARRTGVDALFTGVLPHERVPPYVAAFDVAVAPYAASDGFYFSPLKVVEYLASGVPVVAADIGDLRHCVRPGETGWLYPPSDVDALAARIGDVLEDRSAAATVAGAGRSHAREAHSWRANAEMVAALAAEARSGA